MDWSNDTKVFQTCMDAFHERPSLRTLVSLFYQFPGRLCQHPWDRVLSLLSIASDAAAILVDYSSPACHILLQLVRIYPASMCVWFWFHVVNMLKIRLGPWDGFPQGTPLFKIHMKATFSEFIRGPDPAFWHYCCSSCQRRDLDDYLDDPSEQILLCVKELCTYT